MNDLISLFNIPMTVLNTFFSPIKRVTIAISVFWFILTRVWSGRHHLFDVIAGVLTGSLIKIYLITENIS